MVDFGDAPVLPADPARTHAAIEETVGHVVAAGAIPVVLGGDHSIAEPDMRACAAKHGPLGLDSFRHAHRHRHRGVRRRHLARHADVPARARRASSTRRATCRSGSAATGRARASSRGSGARDLELLHARRAELGIEQVVEQALAIVGDGPTFLSVDIDVLDPAFAPGTGTPEPGGMTTGELLWAARTVAAGVRLVGAEIVEVIPDERRLGGHHRARGRAHRPRDPHRDRPRPPRALEHRGRPTYYPADERSDERCSERCPTASSSPAAAPATRAAWAELVERFSRYVYAIVLQASGSGRRTPRTSSRTSSRRSTSSSGGCATTRRSGPGSPS